MPASIVQVAGNADTGATIAATFTAPPAAGNIVLAFVNSDNVFTVSGSGTRRYTYLSDQQFDIWEYVGTLPQTVTVTPASADYAAVTLIELSGVSGFDLAGTGTAITTDHTTASASTITTTGDNDIILACVAMHGMVGGGGLPTNPVWSNGFTSAATTLPPATNNAATGQWIASKTQVTSGAVGVTSVTWTNQAENSDSVQIAYKAASDDGGTSLNVTPAVANFTMPQPTAIMATVITGGGAMAATMRMQTPVLTAALNLTAVPAHATFTATAPTVTLGPEADPLTLTAPPAHATLAMAAPTLAAMLNPAVTPAQASLVMPTPTLTTGLTLAAPSARVSFTGPTPVLTAQLALAVRDAEITLVMPTPALSMPLNLTASPAQASFTMSRPTLNDTTTDQGRNITIIPGPVSHGWDVAAPVHSWTGDKPTGNQWGNGKPVHGWTTGPVTK